MLTIRAGQVVNIEDSSDGLRVKAKIFGDKNNEIPYAFPLLPKMFQVVPKIGEMVLVITEDPTNAESQRFYIGPVVSQNQYFYWDGYNNGHGSASSLLNGGDARPLEKLSNFASVTEGSFPEKNDVSIVGRKGEDIILKDDEVDIRCGIRTKIDESIVDNESLKGYVNFNAEDPAYIQLKRKNGLIKDGNSVTNIVADKVNIISHKDKNHFNLTDKTELIKRDELDDIMDKLHQVPYGDLLVDALNKIRDAIDNHVHAYPGLPPCKDAFITTLDGVNFNEIKSDNVRIS